jgi:hypothetical protein
MNRQGSHKRNATEAVTVMPDTMDLNVTTPNDNPSALVRNATLPHGESTHAGNRYASLCVVRKKLWKIMML